ncbi:hypothetical protein KST83_00175 [Fusobacterium nucleatum]|uniref:Uncharacterized protein n=1 Tax=Fusobacterium nucleatum subsp. polymorphum TaxID=76857 RepID=A0A2C6ASF1_FUSNP|nr:hypothetical protein [Fusobacterium polymorphum]PHH96247.1 hypothetical protein CA840_02060 [Fusobacterium polymorphum]
MKKLVLMMALVLGVSAMANDCCDVKNNAKCDCTTEKKSENCHYDKEKKVDCDCEVQNTQNNTKPKTKKAVKKVEEKAETKTDKTEVKN